MKPEDQRAAMAEACGFVWYRLPEHRGDTRRYRALFHPLVHEYEGQSEVWLVKAEPTDSIANWDYMGREGHVPDYLSDLTAIRDAREDIIKTLQQRVNFMNTLRTILERRINKPSDYDCLNAEASEQVEALLRITGRWIEQPNKKEDNVSIS